ncbi:hypothetical protein F5Y09DRAFT_353850 [Xylaria sp. FL1042]|nr:hypothetical protein F5Y09DRAFT_353850 [Xylaria sp. FL1042]
MAQVQRTPDSLIFGVEAKDVTSRTPRFNFLPSAQIDIITHVREHWAFHTRFDDLDQLLVRLDLHGYENITNAQGQCVHDIIMKKVKAKITSTRFGFGLLNVYEAGPLSHSPGEFGDGEDSGYES